MYVTIMDVIKYQNFIFNKNIHYLYRESELPLPFCVFKIVTHIYLGFFLHLQWNIEIKYYRLGTGSFNKLCKIMWKKLIYIESYWNQTLERGSWTWFEMDIYSLAYKFSRKRIFIVDISVKLYLAFIFICIWYHFNFKWASGSSE